MNRVLTSRLADIHFCPTKNARTNLLKEGIPDEHIEVVGNTVIDALLYGASKVRGLGPDHFGTAFTGIAPGIFQKRSSW